MLIAILLVVLADTAISCVALYLAAKSEHRLQTAIKHPVRVHGPVK